MKPTTVRWLKLESKGFPAQTEILHGTVKDLGMGLIKWLLRVEMGSRIVMTMTRTEAELTETAGKAILDEDIQAEFAKLFDEETT